MVSSKSKDTLEVRGNDCFSRHCGHGETVGQQHCLGQTYCVQLPHLLLFLTENEREWFYALISSMFWKVPTERYLPCNWTIGQPSSCSSLRGVGKVQGFCFKLRWQLFSSYETLTCFQKQCALWIILSIVIMCDNEPLVPVQDTTALSSCTLRKNWWEFGMKSGSIEKNLYIRKIIKYYF